MFFCFSTLENHLCFSKLLALYKALSRRGWKAVADFCNIRRMITGPNHGFISYSDKVSSNKGVSLLKAQKAKFERKLYETNVVVLR